MLLGLAFALVLLMAVGLMAFIVLNLGAFLWEQQPWVLLLATAAAGGLAVFAARRARRFRPHPGRTAPLHPGITMHAIPVAGSMGLVFTAGYVVMFWFGLPGARPVVLGMAAAGLLFGAALAYFRERRGRQRDGVLLHLRG
jgi:hypothetical protein